MANIPIGHLPEVIGNITGKRPSASTVKRWIRIGYRGVKLEVKGPSHFRYSTTDLVEAFLARCGSVISDDAERSELTRLKLEDLERARTILAEKYGFKHRQKK